MSLKCPMCGKSKSEENLFCTECTEKLNTEYEVKIPEDIEDAKNNTNSESKNQTSEPAPHAVPSFDKKVLKKQKPDLRSNSEKSYYQLSKEKKSHKGVVLTILFVLLVLVFGSALYIYNENVREDNLERSKWEDAQRENTVESYLLFMDEYPAGTFTEEAYAKMLMLKKEESNMWETLKISENTSEFFDFLERYPQSPYKRKVKERLDSIVWKSTLKENSVESYAQYIETATSGLISGDYIGEAQKRFEMIHQTAPTDNEDLAKITEAIDGFFIALSTLSHEKLNFYLAPEVLRFNDSTTIPKDKMIGQLILLSSKAETQSLRFDADISKLKYEKMENDTYHVNVPLQKILQENDEIPNQIKGYIVHLKLNSDFKVFSYYETKPYVSAP